jgi:hypothetical protein
MFRVELPAPLGARVMVVGFRFVMGSEGEIEAERLTVPE